MESRDMELGASNERAQRPTKTYPVTPRFLDPILAAHVGDGLQELEQAQQTFRSYHDSFKSIDGFTAALQLHRYNISLTRAKVISRYLILQETKVGPDMVGDSLKDLQTCLYDYSECSGAHIQLLHCNVLTKDNSQSYRRVQALSTRSSHVERGSLVSAPRLLNGLAR